MAQTPAVFVQDGEVIDYTPTVARKAGEVILVGTIPMIVPSDIEANELGSLCTDDVWKIPQKAEIITAGDAVYWDVDGTPVTGTALSGAATGTSTAGNLMGVCIKTSAAADSYVMVLLTAAKRTTTIAGSVTADDITGSDASLNISGLAAAAGGTVVIAGGAGSAGAGGLTSMTGGAGTGAAGGAASVVGGQGGAASVGGAASLTGGAVASGNAIGGAAAVTGGRGSGTQVGGAASLVAGAGGPGAGTGAGGAVAVTGGAGAATSGTGGAVAIAGGAGSAGNADGGAVTILGGAKNGSGAHGAIAIGTSNTSSITLGLMPLIPTATVAATGSTQADAAPITTGFTKVTNDSAAKGIALPAAVAGAVCIVKNSYAGVTKVWPCVGANDTINGAAADATMVNGLPASTGCIFVALDATAWWSIPLVPS
jgi:predicted RecA/RadA family phage recombinase